MPDQFTAGRRNPLSTLQLALQLQEIMRQQQMGPDEDLMRYQRLLPYFSQLPEDQSGAAEERFLGVSRAPRERAAGVKKEYLKTLSADALNDLENLEAQFKSQQDQLMAQLMKFGEDPNVDIEPIFAQAGMDLAQRRQRQFQDFVGKHRAAARTPDVQGALKHAQSLYGPEGTKYNFAEAMMRGKVPAARRTQGQIGGDIVAQTQKRLPLYQALLGIEESRRYGQ